jgi:hypothetical protein
MTQPDLSLYSGIVSDLTSTKALWSFVISDIRVIAVVSAAWWIIPLNPKTLNIDSSQSRVSSFRAIVGGHLSVPLLLWALVAIHDTLKILMGGSVVPEHNVFVYWLEVLSLLWSMMFVLVAGVLVAGVFGWFRVQAARPSWPIIPALLGVFTTLLIQSSVLYYSFLIFLEYLNTP